ncbi:efflux RND transporter periplasmic adaptor subunit [Opitutus terrae]|uniref:Efflux transporter, RND family, MFP subunit n=1 Tax=Opitutus terrae (strain DSM 11246 / JCM 15787 / PB90-1) TaxID=452637 RepID=B1ZSV5_OPITP|nr:efflux RND transporter periplasmic adaptor subunit [Opitutus terrae]ACB74799.1 efflux transporter, RND family, MFP subunit [Opitutus terrae PB90-1]
MSAERPSLAGLRIDRSNAPRRTFFTPPVIGTVVVLLLLAAAAAWWFTRPKPFPVRTAPAREIAAGEQATLLNASGYVTARRWATVSSKVMGKIIEVLVDEGARVEAGQVLARIDASNTEANLRLAESQLDAARKALAETEAQLELAELDLKRQRELAAKQIVSPADLDRAESAARALRGRRERGLSEIVVAQRQVDVWRQQLDDTVIRAPFAGVVTSKNAQPGEMISPMSSGGFTRTGVCTLVDMSSLEIEVDVNESYINRVTAGQPVVATLDSYPDWKIPSRVIAIIPTADRQKATVKVRVGFDQLDPRILPDMGVKVAFQSTTPAAQPAARTVVVPRSAVRSRQGRDIVWVVERDRVTSRAVTVANKNGDEFTLSAGLNGGELIVVEGPEDLSDGALVTEKKP